MPYTKNSKEQKITITSSTKLSEDEINAKIKEAEQYAEEDKKQKEAVETKNQAEGLMFETEKQMNDLGDKATDDEKKAVEDARADLQKAIDASDIEDMKAKMEALTNAFYPISTRIYQEAQAQQQAAGADAGAANAGTADGTVDADYEVVDEDK